MDKASRALLTHTRVWYLIDAANQRPGRLATQISPILQGKYKPIFHRSVDCGDHVVLINTKKIEFSGKKWDDKLYRWHTFYPGGFRSIKAKDLHARKPTEIVRKAINGMLPRNSFRSKWMDRLHLFEGDEYPYAENIAADLTKEVGGVSRQIVPKMVLKAPADIHLLEEFEKDEYTGEVLLHLELPENPK
eukprot:m.214599 g.214599  ORF g.214599 m.214599 type:complete len:190 (+) comp15869_c4_seq6:171-740(+)